MEVSRNQDFTIVCLDFDTMHTAGIKALQIIPLIEKQSCYDNAMSQYDWLGGISKYFIQYKNNMLLKNFFIPALSEHVHKLTGSYHSISFRQDNGNHAHS